MAGAAFVIFAGDRDWRIVSPGATDELRFGDEATAATIAHELAAAMRRRGYQGQGTLLAVASTWCLSAIISTADLPRGDRAAMLFRLEEQLPIAAEHFTADFVAHGGQALGVCVPNDRIAPLVEALEGEGVVVQSISPVAMLALESAGLAGGGVVLWGEGESVNVIRVEEGRAAAWALAGNPAELQLHLRMMAMDAGDVDVAAWDVPEGWLTGSAVAASEVGRRDIYGAAGKMAGAVLSGRVTPWIELRRDALAIRDSLRLVRRGLNAALVAATLFAVVLAAVLIYRGVRYDRLASSLDAQMTEEFKKEFPGWTVTNVRAVVESERRKLESSASSSLPAEAQESALRVLRNVLGKISGDVKLSLDRMAISDTTVEFEGRAARYEDVDALVLAGKNAGMDVPPPQMRKTTGGLWSFVVRGAKPPPGKVAGGVQ